ncbi:MAG: MFS transporter [Acidobacteria bacterium]|nr:MFS transporter [Acidobacteriota bacterium]
MESSNYRELLRNNINFRRLWVGQLISELGTWFSFIAELGTVAMLSGSPLATMVFLISRLLPVLLFAPLAGVIVDRANRKKVMIAADLIRALLALGFLTVNIGAPLWLVVLLSGLITTASTFFDAAKNAAVANMVTRKEMLTGNVLMFSMRFLQFTLGAALGGITAVKFGYTTAFIVNSLSYVASALFIWLIPAGVMRNREPGEALMAEVEEGGNRASTRFWQEVREGLQFIRVTPFVRAIILVNIGWALGGGMNNLIFDRVARHEFLPGAGDRGDWNLALLWTAGGAGLFIGMMLARRASSWAADERRAGALIGWSLLFHGLCFALGGFMPSLSLIACCLAISRLILGAEFGFQETLMMRAIPDNYRGRVFTTDRALELSTMTISMIVSGSLLTWVNPRTMIIVSGLLSASPGIVWLLAMWQTRFGVPAAAVRDGISPTQNTLPGIVPPAQNNFVVGVEIESFETLDVQVAEK